MKRLLMLGFLLLKIALFALFLSGCGDLEESDRCSAAISSRYLTSKDCQPLSWQSLPILLTKDPSLPSELSIAIDDAIDIWERETGVDLFQIVAAGSQNTIATRTATTWEEEPVFGKNEEPAKTVYLYRQNKLFDTDIFFNEAFHFSLQGSSGTFDATTICLHELGHVLGLDHDNDTSPEKSIMNAQIQKTERRYLSPRDIDRVRQLYP